MEVTSSEDEEVFEPTPFEVEATGQARYQERPTLAGPRICTDLSAPLHRINSPYNPNQHKK